LRCRLLVGLLAVGCLLTGARQSVSAAAPGIASFPRVDAALGSTEWSGYAAKAGHLIPSTTPGPDVPCSPTSRTPSGCGGSPFCATSIGVPSGVYNPNTGVLNAFVVGNVYCNFQSSSIFETIWFKGYTGSQGISNQGEWNNCVDCSGLPNVEATYSAIAPCGAANYRHYGQMQLEYFLPDGEFVDVIDDGPPNQGTVYNYNSPPC
jgi:hypothetical protein